MTDRAKQIEEMAIGVCEYRKARGYKKCDDCDWGGECGVTEYARELYDAGYRKASDVIDEFVERLKEENEISFRRYGKGIGISTIFRIADEMRQEVEK